MAKFSLFATKTYSGLTFRGSRDVQPFSVSVQLFNALGMFTPNVSITVGGVDGDGCVRSDFKMMLIGFSRRGGAHFSTKTIPVAQLTSRQS